MSQSPVKGPVYYSMWQWNFQVNYKDISIGNKMIHVECGKGMLNPNKTLALEKESQPRWM